MNFLQRFWFWLSNILRGKRQVDTMAALADYERAARRFEDSTSRLVVPDVAKVTDDARSEAVQSAGRMSLHHSFVLTAVGNVRRVFAKWFPGVPAGASVGLGENLSPEELATGLSEETEEGVAEETGREHDETQSMTQGERVEMEAELSDMTPEERATQAELWRTASCGTRAAHLNSTQMTSTVRRSGHSKSTLEKSVDGGSSFGHKI